MKHFTLLVIGDNPDKQVEKFSNFSLEKPIVLFYKDKAKEYHDIAIKYFKNAIEIDNSLGNIIENKLQMIQNMTDDEYFEYLTKDFEIDEETGNGITYNNVNAKYDYISNAGHFATPFITNDGKEVYEAKKGEINWEKIHLIDSRAYEVAWETVIDGRKPKDSEEQQVYDNMKNHKQYLLKYGTKNHYVKVSTSFWTYAIIKNGIWYETTDNSDDWVCDFYEKNIKDLSNNTNLKIFECIREDF